MILAQLPSLVSSRTRNYFRFLISISFSANRDRASKSEQERTRVIEFGKFFCHDLSKERRRASAHDASPKSRSTNFAQATPITASNRKPVFLIPLLTPGYCVLACKSTVCLLCVDKKAFES